MGFAGLAFWLTLYFQEVKQIAPLGVAVRMLPMAIVGILVNVVAGFIMHVVSNKLLMTIGALSFCGCFALLSAMPSDGFYWAYIFPALCLAVIGADFQFTVVNVSRNRLSFADIPLILSADVRHVFVTSERPVDSWRHSTDSNSTRD